MFAAMLHHVWLTSCVATECRLWANGPSSMSLQVVSVQNNVCQRSTHALSIVWDLTLQCLLAPRPHVCCCVAPRVADKLCCHWMSALDQWSFFNGLAACERAEQCMAEVYSCFERGLGLDFAMYVVFLLYKHKFAIVLHHMWLTSCVASGCRLWTNGPSSMGLQHVSV
jgi:hypothetical protein